MQYIWGGKSRSWQSRCSSPGRPERRWSHGWVVAAHLWGTVRKSLQSHSFWSHFTKSCGMPHFLTPLLWPGVSFATVHKNCPSSGEYKALYSWRQLFQHHTHPGKWCSSLLHGPAACLNESVSTPLIKHSSGSAWTLDFWCRSPGLDC